MTKILLIAALVGSCGLLHANTIVAPASVLALDGDDAYSWGISIAVPTGQVVTSAQIDFTDITLTGSRGAGYIYTSLLNSQAAGVTVKSDGDAAGNYWATQFSGANITSVGTETFATVGTTLTWDYILNASELAALNAYLTTGTFNIGIDPDGTFGAMMCDYNMGSIVFNYTLGQPPPPARVPEQATTAFLLFISLAGLEIFRRRFIPARCQA
jgi:hypothetical protein